MSIADDIYTPVSESDKFGSIEHAKRAVEKADKIHNDMIKAMADTFSGIEVRIDPELEGERYYISMSKELFEKLKQEKNERSKTSQNSI